MSYKVKITAHFDKEIKRIAKKHKGVRTDLAALINDLKENPTKGTDIGGGYYKIRLSISGSNKGKSGGARVITFVVFVEETVYLSEVYLKSEHDSVDPAIISKRLKGEGII
ncbi:type II toxin-antitoxin system RelE/ParE family toxin [Mucilaginibacter sp.]|uniref:type II toxin-antitoxin system RelE/ParE family toxin n=1 Tax=Mucilaginibacter sp. TaxID=1882438 RepID=UPI0032672679